MVIQLQQMSLSVLAGRAQLQRSFLSGRRQRPIGRPLQTTMAKEPIADSSSDGNPKLEQIDPAISEVETQGKGHVPGALSYHSLIAAANVAWYSGTHVLYQEDSGLSSLCARSAAVCVSPWLLLCIRVHHVHAASMMRCCGCGRWQCVTAIHVLA